MTELKLYLIQDNKNVSFWVAAEDEQQAQSCISALSYGIKSIKELDPLKETIYDEYKGTHVIFQERMNEEGVGLYWNSDWLG